MSTNNAKSNKWIGAGLLTAILASLCCITPMMSLIAGLSGIAASFSFLEPFRLYFIGATILVLGIAWYQKLKASRKEMDCACDPEEKLSFFQTKKFLTLVTVFALAMLAFPYYSGSFFPQHEPVEASTPSAWIKQAELKVEGMTCQGCEQHVNHTLYQQKGVVKATSSYREGAASVEFDSQKITLDELMQAIEKETGYKVSENK
jgi:mercuric ion transport protein